MPPQGDSILEKVEQRKGAIKREPRASDYATSSNSGFGYLRVSVCLVCKILGVFLHFLSLQFIALPPALCWGPSGDCEGPVVTKIAVSFAFTYLTV